MTPWPPPAMAVATGGGRAAGPATGPGTGIAGVATAPTAAISVVAVAIAERPRPVTPLAIVAAANRGPGRHDREVGQTGPSSALRWVLDPTDDHACVRALLGLHNDCRYKAFFQRVGWIDHLRFGCEFCLFPCWFLRFRQRGGSFFYGEHRFLHGLKGDHVHKMVWHLSRRVAVRVCRCKNTGEFGNLALTSGPNVLGAF